MYAGVGTVAEFRMQWARAAVGHTGREAVGNGQRGYASDSSFALDSGYALDRSYALGYTFVVKCESKENRDDRKVIERDRAQWKE